MHSHRRLGSLYGLSRAIAPGNPRAARPASSAGVPTSRRWGTGKRAAVRSSCSPEACAAFCASRTAWSQRLADQLRCGQERKPTDAAATVDLGVAIDGPFTEAS